MGRNVRRVLRAGAAIAAVIALRGVALASDSVRDTTRAATAASQGDQPQVPRIGIGDTAPAFTLTDHSGKDVSLADFAGKRNVILAFYVFAFTGG